MEQKEKHEAAGLVFAGFDDWGESLWVGTDDDWNKFEGMCDDCLGDGSRELDMGNGEIIKIKCHCKK